MIGNVIFFQLFGAERHPINLPCGHTVCHKCLADNRSQFCVLDQVPVTVNLRKLPVNAAFLSILGVQISKELCDPERFSQTNECFLKAEKILIRLSSYLHQAESERGGSVWSNELSRPLQRKLIALLCFQLLEDEGRQRARKVARALVERILTELIILHQNTANLSSCLWSAVRARGCQFLGPAMQEEVLRLILLTLSEGALIARKTLVMYIVQTLREDYPQVSKTSVGHVVQLLYRASCFNVMKREGESSLMQLKTEFRDYESLRREHDTQIVQVAIEAGLRISPDQWSSLLYGDQSHRSHMQSIIDKLQVPQAFDQMYRELKTILQRSGDCETVVSIFKHFEHFNELDSSISSSILFIFLDFKMRKLQLFNLMARNVKHLTIFGANHRDTYLQNKKHSKKHVHRRFFSFTGKLIFVKRCEGQLFRDTEAGRSCPRGIHCTYAHSQSELRQSIHRRFRGNSRFTDLKNMQYLKPNFSYGSSLAISKSTVPVLPISIDSGAVVGSNQRVGSDLSGLMHLPVMPIMLQSNQSMKQYSSLTNQLTTFGTLNGTDQSISLATVWPTTVSNVSNNINGNIGTTDLSAIVQFPVATSTTTGSSPSTFSQIPIPLLNPPSVIVDPNVFHWIPPCLNTQFYSELCDIHCSFPIENFEVYNNEHTSFTDDPNHNSLHNLIVSDSAKSAKNSCIENEELLIMRRKEIVSRLTAMNSNIGEEVDDDDIRSHVSYTVANSVLFDDKEVISTGFLQLPPLPLPYSAASPTQVLTHLGDVAAITTNVLSLCPSSTCINGTKPATVQATCAVMQVKDIISQPLPSPAIQFPRSQTKTMEKIDSSSINNQISSVIRSFPLTPCDPQNVVSATLDRIVDVRERLNDINKSGGLGCAVEKQLKVELNIVSRQIQSLDHKTKHSCLLRELQEVEKKIEYLNSHC
ncbi:unnamed protein product [Dracunculus medinensis]|uniref:RING-type E3 ubiquitin transferase n=1 Tax=Dracunculus medinensis TaxID=318479 RepID=A0A3P7Q6K2_DRAME|nr:unnamed protein product [Dracunculus medinensis]